MDRVNSKVHVASMSVVNKMALGQAVNQDLRRERERCSFDIEELVNFHDGSRKITEMRRRIENEIFSVKDLKDEIPEEYLSHKEKYENAIRKTALLFSLYRRMEDTTTTDPNWGRIRDRITMGIVKDSSPFTLHSAMFMPTIIGQGTEEQQRYWLDRAQKMEILGSYAQTELGHGTFLRGLETTATYDESSEEFILHSPTLTSYKWWPGNLGHTVNYCVVMAQLFTKGKHCGMHQFLVQIRDEETHMPLPGIKVGEIGAKMGFNTVNNGFLGFEHHRIPRDRMLMKNAHVSKDGTFKMIATNPRLVYGTMIFVRVYIVNVMSIHLARAVTIAVRYSAVRRQSKLKQNEQELQILDYLTQQHKLFIALASSYAFSVVAKWLWDYYTKVNAQLSTGNLDDLPELHSLSCCLKSVTTMDALAMVEKCRTACGGHGYMHSSNFPTIYGLVAAAYTYEGEHTVLMLQTARSLVKAWHQAKQGKPLSPTMAYLLDTKPLPKWDGSIDCIVRSFQRVAAKKLQSCVETIEKCVDSGMSPEDAWNRASVQLVVTTEAHCRAVIVSTLKTEIDKVTSIMSPPLKKVIDHVIEMYSVYWTLQKLGDLLLYVNISQNDVRALQMRYEDLLELIRPNIVGLVDGFDFRDEILHSTLGAYDGRVYERLMEEALKSPLNAEPVNASFHRHLKPFMQGKL